MWWSTRLFLIDLLPALFFRYTWWRTLYGDPASLISGAVADLAFVAALAALTSFLHARTGRKSVFLVPALCWWFYCAVMTTYFRAMHGLPSLRQAVYLVDLHFIAASLTTPLIAAVVAVTAALSWGFLRMDLRFRPMGKITPAALALLFVASLLLPGRMQTGNPLVIQVCGLFSGGGEVPGSLLRLEQDLSGTPLAAHPKARPNVLLVVLEGIPGGYIRQDVEFTKSSADFTMPKLSAWADRGLRVPNFLTHRNQTINGLYSMLCAGYPRLSDGTPIVQELLARPISKDYMPGILSRNGYHTTYLQAAGLRFMDKDRFMKLAGFDEVLGDQWLESTPAPAFFSRWGIDDRGFFLRSLDKIRELDAARQASNGKTPWFLTLLTVGTHYPYELPDDFTKGENLSPKLRSVSFLDDAIDLFLTRLEKEGVMKDTLVIVTSDESHGMDSDVLLAGNWGLCFALAPQGLLPRGLSGVNPGLFGLVDLPLSILDYTDLLASADGVAGRSIFRDYPASGKRALAGSWGSRFFVVSGDTLLLKDFGSDRLVKYAIPGSPFSLTNGAKAEGEERGEGIFREAEQLSAERLNARESRLALKTWRFLPDDSTYKVAECDTSVPISGDSRLWLSGGQYIRLRKGERYVLDLDVSASESNTRPVLFDWMIYRLNDASRSGISFFISGDSFRLPVLDPGDRLTLSCAVEVREDFTLDSARLAARIDRRESNGADAHIEVKNFALRQIGALVPPSGRVLYEGQDGLFLLNAFFLTTAQGQRVELEPKLPTNKRRS